MRCTRSNAHLRLFALIACCFHPVLAKADNVSTCDRGRSRSAKAVLRQYVLPMAAKAQCQLTEQCPFHPMRDVYGMQDAARHKHQGIQWKCGFCHKIFRTEPFLDQHMANHHQNETHPDAHVCLAELCDVLHCDHFAKGSGGGFHYFQHHSAPCKPKTKGQLKHHCQDIADTCFLGEDNRATLMYDYFVEHFCEAHTCNKQERLDRLTAVAQVGSPHRVWGYRILVGLLMLFMALLYAGIWMYLQYYSGHSNSDLRQVKQSSLWSQLVKKKKVY